MRCLLTFYAIEDRAARSRSQEGSADGHDGPFIEAKESVGSYAVVEIQDEAEAIAKGWPAGGVVEVRPVAE